LAGLVLSGGERAVTARADGTLTVWDVQTRRETAARVAGFLGVPLLDEVSAAAAGPEDSY
jgi:hypothetical protein